VATMFDVASAAGVSHQTVSRVVNGDPSVRPATKAKVDAAIERLAYRPSAAARALASRRTRTLGLISTGFPLYGPSSTMHGFNGAARAAGYQVSMATLDASDTAGLRPAVDALLGQDVAALVVVAADASTLSAVAALDPAVPLVVADALDEPGRHTVSIDQALGARLVVEHLHGLGHRSIAHVAGPAPWTDACERRRGWAEACAELGVDASVELAGDWSAASGHRLGLELARRGDVTAVFCANDQMAMGVVHAFADEGVRVPDDVSVVGFDDLPEAAHVVPPLTSVRQDFEALGRRIMTVVEALLAGEDVPAVVERPDLVVRLSSAPPRR